MNSITKETLFTADDVEGVGMDVEGVGMDVGAAEAFSAVPLQWQHAVFASTPSWLGYEEPYNGHSG